MLKLKDIFAGQSDAPSQQPLQKDDAVREISPKAPIQKQPAVLKSASSKEQRVFIDAVTRDRGRLVVLGWSTSPLMDFTVYQKGNVLPATFSRHMRGDVADALNLPSGDMLGFSLISNEKAEDFGASVSIKLPRSATYETGILGETTALTQIQRTLLPVLLKDRIVALQNMQIGSDDWWEAVDELPESTTVPTGFHGFVEGILVSPIGNAVIFGWAVHPEDAIIWLEDEMQNVYHLNSAFRRERKDVSAGIRNVLWADMDAGFIAYFPEISKNPSIRLRAVTEQGVVTIYERTEVDLLPQDPRSVAEKLFSIVTEERVYHRRVGKVDWPMLLPLIEQHRKEVSSIEPVVDIYGIIPNDPSVSIIIPIYKRFDFMEHQLLEFIQDPFLKDSVELIYVIDDPEIRTSVLNSADHLFNLYKLPFKVISGLRNRGFSGANNLGAQYANSSHLIFMNSDVIPIASGWIERLLHVCLNESLGAVGVRLLFPDGSIQQDGLKLLMHTDLSITLPSNHNSGINPQDLCDEDQADIECLSGACLLITKDAFAQVGGWNEDLVLSWGADVALSQALRKQGYNFKLVVDTPLTHLGQQSVSSIGDWHFRNRIKLLNAVYLRDVLSYERNIEVSED